VWEPLSYHLTATAALRSAVSGSSRVTPVGRAPRERQGPPPRRTAMTAPPTLGVVLAAMLWLLAACGGEAGDERASGTADAPAPTSPSPATSAPREDLVLPPSGGDSVLTGIVEAGVEPGCLLLEASGVVHLLVGAAQDLVPGARVTVRGRPDPTLVTTCQQGTPFVVTTSSAA
jgi:hypothetical protein